MEKQVKSFFTLPEDIKGKTDYGKRKHIIFYFDKETDYEKIVAFFCGDTIYKDVPMPSTSKLLKLLPSFKKKVKLKSKKGGRLHWKNVIQH